MCLARYDNSGNSFWYFSVTSLLKAQYTTSIIFLVLYYLECAFDDIVVVIENDDSVDSLRKRHTAKQRAGLHFVMLNAVQYRLHFSLYYTNTSAMNVHDMD